MAVPVMLQLFLGDLERHRLAFGTTRSILETGLDRGLPGSGCVRADFLAGHLSDWSLHDMHRLVRCCTFRDHPDCDMILSNSPIVRTPVPGNCTGWLDDWCRRTGCSEHDHRDHGLSEMGQNS